MNNTAPQPAPGTPLITVQAISKSYQRGIEKIQVLDRLSLSINRGEFVALMGPSGSGKTTLLNLIAGIDIPDEGNLSVNGAELARMRESELAAWRATHVGFVFQFYNLIPVLTAIENVALPLSIFSMSKQEREERARFALDIVGLGDRADHLPSQLSGGQEQRVAIARAIVTDPTIIVADEPTGDLDRVSATEVLQLLQRLNRESGKTIVMVTHDHSAAQYASRTIMLDKGRLVE